MHVPLSTWLQRNTSFSRHWRASAPQLKSRFGKMGLVLPWTHSDCWQASWKHNRDQILKQICFLDGQDQNKETCPDLSDVHIWWTRSDYILIMLLPTNLHVHPFKTFFAFVHELLAPEREGLLWNGNRVGRETEQILDKIIKTQTCNFFFSRTSWDHRL